MIDVDALYFKWMMEQLNNDSIGFERLCWMLHRNIFQRRVGNDLNRYIDGANLRRSFLNDYDDANISPSLSNDLMGYECSWLEMLLALSMNLDYLYEGGVRERFLELIDNLDLTKIIFTPQSKTGGKYDELDQDYVDVVTTRVDSSLFESNGHGGLFPLQYRGHPDQRGVEIWEQHAAYFREKLEGVMWTSTS